MAADHSSTLDQKVMKFLIFFWEKVRLHSYFVIFFLEEGGHKCARKDTSSFPNDTNDSALEKRSLGASFEQ